MKVTNPKTHKVSHRKIIPQKGNDVNYAFPCDLILSDNNKLKPEFVKATKDLIDLPKPPQLTSQKAYIDLYEQILLNLARCISTQKWLCIAGSNNLRPDGTYKYDQTRCHIYKSEKRTKKLLQLLIEKELITKVAGQSCKIRDIEDHYFPSKKLINALQSFSTKTKTLPWSHLYNFSVQN